jgi:poly-gamma-glutamate capsule biosynthesis protein CapA/YwtB (metallophosphatase superfamily)
LNKVGSYNLKDRLLIGLTGDVMIGRGVNKAISKYGYSYPWGDVLPLIKSSDVNIVNLETALTYSRHPVTKVFNFKADPDKVKTLTEAQIKVANLANNHILDFAEEGLIETLHTLDEAGIKYTGASINEQEASHPAIVSFNSFQIGILGYTDNEPGWKAGPENCGTNHIDVSDTKDKKRVLTAIQHLREEVDFLIVSIHWGPNMREEPPPAFIDFAHQVVQEGADVIHGHSAHIFQAIEVYNHKLILYDSGDFIDDYVVNPMLRNDLSF